ncbi:hypothetical protein B0H63DRAFT_565848 [Podospora didyma]|uniref:Peptidase S8/S53 domain-containing protein n=1 Tax=Podospora didyma TaxID=330526 RepID=A0AAE0K0Z8_9PEZI|nr:hypothetical protein B0H63DRAFT_565848 [Podospora didyma]
MKLWLVILALTNLSLLGLASGKEEHNDTDSNWCGDQAPIKHGETCCSTPKSPGKYHLCGRGTICCGDACCPKDWLCSKGSCKKPKHYWHWKTKTTAAATTTQDDPDCESSTVSPPTTITTTLDDCETAVIINGTKTITLPDVTSRTTLTSGGLTFTLGPTETEVSSTSRRTEVSSTSRRSTTSRSSVSFRTTPTSRSTTRRLSSRLSSASRSSTGSSSGGGGGGGEVTSVNSGGQTVISGTGGAITVPTGITTPFTFTASNGQVITFTPTTRPGGITSTPTGSSGVTSTPSIVTNVNSAGQTVISNTGGAITIPTGLTTPITITASNGDVFTFTPSLSLTNPGGDVTSVNSNGQTVISNTGGAITLPTGITTPIVITQSNGQVTTFFPPGVSPPSSSRSVPSSGSGGTTTVNSDGQTVISNTGGAVTIPTGITTPITTTNSGGQVITFFPPGVTPPSSTLSSSTVPQGSTTVNSNGQTVISNTGGAVTLPTGITTPITTTNSGGQVITFFPPGFSQASSTLSSTASAPQGSTTVNSNGQTVISNTGGAVTLPTGITTPITTTNSGGQAITFFPPGFSQSSSTSSSAADQGTTTVNSNGQTVISNTGGGFTIPTGITTPIVVTNSGGQSFTFFPPGASSSSSTSSSTTTPTSGVTTTVNSNGQTVISDTRGAVTLPTGVTTPITTTDSDGDIFTWIPPTATSSSSTSSSSDGSTPIAWLGPIFTPVDEPKRDDDGESSDVPCTAWFFFICIRWGDLNIGGWKFNLPPGIRPPGPPPPFSIDPSLHLTFSVSGTLPPWPAITIGPDRVPTYSPKPSDQPDGECETESAEICATRTSYGVSVSSTVTSTTLTSVMSTCATVYGCSVSDSGTTATTTGACTSASTITDIYLSCPTAGTLVASCSTTSTSTTTGCSVTPSTVTCNVLVPRATGVAPQPACITDSSVYVVYPRNGRDQAQVNRIAVQLRTMETNPDNIYTSNTRTLGLNFWRLVLTDSQATTLRQNSDVASVNIACSTFGLCTDPTTNLVFQENVQDQLVHVSWPAGMGWTTLDDFPAAQRHRYYFDDSAARDIPVYIVDSGAMLTHPVAGDNPEFAWARQNVEWLHIGQDTYPSVLTTQPEDDSQREKIPNGGHGTAMLSIVLGDTLGVAKRAKPYLVRLPRRNILGGFTPEDFLEGVGRVSDELTSSGLGAVVLMAIFWPLEQFVRRDRTGMPVRLDVDDPGGGPPIPGPTIDESFGFDTRLKSLIENIISKGGIPVTGSGNGGGTVMGGMPAKYGDQASAVDYIPGIVVAGAVAADGTVWPRTKFTQNGNLPHVWAPGSGVRVANGLESTLSGGVFYRDNSEGTSDAAAHTAGLAAYFIGLNNVGNGLMNRNGQRVDTVARLFDYIVRETAWPKISGQTFFTVSPISSIWNFVDLEAQGACQWNPNSRPRRRLRDLQARQSDAPRCELPLSSRTSSSTSSSRTSSSTSSSSTTSSSSSRVSSTSSTSSRISSSSSSSSSSTRPPPPTTTTSTTSSTPPPRPTTPLEEFPVDCNNEDDLPGHADIRGGAQSDQAFDFCLDKAKLPNGDVTLGPGDPAVEVTYFDNFDISYRYRIEWVNDCITTVERQNMIAPFGTEDETRDTCFDVLVDCYTQCNNGGVGGAIQVGCLRYLFVGGE